MENLATVSLRKHLDMKLRPEWFCSNPETALKLSRNIGKKNQCDSNYLFDEEEARTSWDHVATFGEQIAEERNVTVWVRRSHRTRLQTCLFKAWRPNPLGQLSAEHINYYTQTIACFFLNCYSSAIKVIAEWGESDRWCEGLRGDSHSPRKLIIGFVT